MQTAAAIAATLVSLAATGSLAQGDAGKPQAVATPAAAGVKMTARPNPDAIVCVHHDQPGTRIPGRAVCHPQRVWDQLTETARDETQNLQQRSFFFKNNQ